MKTKMGISDAYLKVSPTWQHRWDTWLVSSLTNAEWRKKGSVYVEDMLRHRRPHVITDERPKSKGRGRMHVFND